MPPALKTGWSIHVNKRASAEAAIHVGHVTMETNQGMKTRVHVPADAVGKTIHIVCEVRDDGNPPLVGYRRVICTVRGQGEGL